MTSTDPNPASDARSIQPQQAAAAADAVPFLIVGATLSDPGLLLASIAQSGDDITLTTAAASISNSPDTAISWERPLTSVFGGVSGFSLGDVFRAIGRVHELAPPADMHFGMSIESADGARGAAWRIAAVGANWQVQHGAKVAGSWGAWSVATSQAMTRAFEGQ